MEKHGERWRKRWTESKNSPLPAQGLETKGKIRAKRRGRGGKKGGERERAV